MTLQPEPLERLEFDTAALMTEHPPVWHHPNKQVVFDIGCGPDRPPAGSATYTRWAAMALPEVVDLGAAAAIVVARDGYFD